MGAPSRQLSNRRAAGALRPVKWLGDGARVLSDALRSRGEGAAELGPAAGTADTRVVDEQEFIRLLGLEIERAKRGDRCLSILVARVEGIEQPDDVPAGPNAELVPESLSRTLVEQKRQIDSAGTLNGGRIALMLPETGEHGAMVIGERVHGVLSERVGDLPASVGFGIAAFPRHGRSPEALVRAADRALAAARALSRPEALGFGHGGGLVLTTPPPNRNGSEPSESLQALLALAETVDVRDHLTAGHAQLVGRYAELIAREFGLSDGAVRRIRLAGVLHDVGKFGVPRAVLQKPGPLDESEWEAVKRHPEIGAQLLKGSELDDIREWIRDHHEQPDGQGYPRALKAGEISLEARMLAVADAYEAMTTERAHRAALSHTVAREELNRCAGTQFDRRVVQAFLRQLERQCLVQVKSTG